MSRIGKKPVPVPKGVTVNVSGRTVTAKGAKGTVEVGLPPGVTVSTEAGEITVAPGDGCSPGAWGLARSLLANAVEGVTKGYQKRLLVVGVGYRAEASGSKLTLNVGYSHQVVIEAPKGVTFAVEPQITVPGKKDNYPATPVLVQGADKQLVGSYAAKVRAVKPPEPYLWKGIRYEGERLRTDKAGKTAK